MFKHSLLHAISSYFNQISTPTINDSAIRLCFSSASRISWTHTASVEAAFNGYHEEALLVVLCSVNLPQLFLASCPVSRTLRLRWCRSFSATD